jgi:hypothetical protein
MTVYLEVCKLPYPDKGMKIRFHRESKFNRDDLSPSMVCVIGVENVKTKEEAVATCLRKIAGHLNSYGQVHHVF